MLPIIRQCKIWLAGAWLFLALNQIGIAQITNSIPKNIYLTDQGLVFWYGPGGTLVVKTEAIDKARKLPESRPAEQDVEDHWGQATNGFQLALRFQKTTFTNGEPIKATMFMRNVTDKPQTYYRPTYIIATKDDRVLENKNAGKQIIIDMLPETKLIPQTQCEDCETVNDSYDLSTPGTYIFQAVCRNPIISSEPVAILITNGTR
jgi:hypothetical protein